MLASSLIAATQAEAASALALDARQEDTLWQRFKAEGDMAARDLLIRHYLDFARILAGRAYARRYRDTVSFGEYMQLASLGLIEAVDKFSPADGRATFRSYAAHWIRGAILHGLRSLSEVHAQIEARKRTKRDRLYSLSRAPHVDDNEAATEDTPTAQTDQAEDPFNRLADIAMGVALGFMLDDLRIYQSADGLQEDNSYTDAEMRRLRQVLSRATLGLSGKERELIDKHYFEGHTFDEVAQHLTVSKGRVSQLHKRALGALRTAMSEAGYGDWCI
jgi:RNA polymerase sigma factor for flagellar operon FliA